MQDDNLHQSPDDALEPNSDQDGMFHPQTDQERLEQDFDSPASPPNDIIGPVLPADHPQGDTNADQHEVYDEGESDAQIDNREEDLAGDPPKRIG